MKLNNVIFPIWMLWLFPLVWLIIIPSNFIIDSLILIISMKLLKINNKKSFYKKHIFKIFLFGILSDIIGSLYLIIMFFGFNVGKMGDELYLTIPGIIVSSIMIFIFNYYITFKKIEKKERMKLAVIYAIVTAPYTFLIPISYMY